MPYRNRRTRLRRQRAREEAGERFRSEPHLELQIQESPVWSDISRYAEEIAAPNVAEMLGELYTYRHIRRDRLEFFAQKDGPADGTLQRNPDGTLQYQIGDLPPNSRRDLDNLTQTSLGRIRNQISTAIQYQIQNFTEARQTGEFAGDRVRKGLAGYVLRLATETTLALTFHTALTKKGEIPCTTRQIGPHVRRILQQSIVNQETVHSVRELEPKQNRHPNRDACLIAHYNAVTLAEPALRLFRDLHPTAAAYHWKVMLQRDMDDTPFQTAEHLEQMVRARLQLTDPEWRTFHDMDATSTAGYLWHKEDAWIREAVARLTQANLNQQPGCHQIRSEILSAQIAHEAADALGRTQQWMQSLRELADRHPQCDLREERHTIEERDALREHIKELAVA